MIFKKSMSPPVQHFALQGRLVCRLCALKRHLRWCLCVGMYKIAARAKGKYLLGTMWPAEQADVPVRPIHHKQKTQTQPPLIIFQTVSSREPDHCRIQITVTQREPRWLIDPQLDCQSTDALEQYMKGQWEVLLWKISYSYSFRHFN